MESEVVENKGLPGNGLTDAVAPEEEPLRRSSNSSGKKKPKKEKISLVISSGNKGTDDDDLSETEDEKVDKLDSCARKCRLTPKRSLIYLIVSSVVIFVLLLILIILAALWPSSPSQQTCQTAQCHGFSAQILESMNASSEACQDVWEYGCGGWLENHREMLEKTGHWDVDLEHELHVKEKSRKLLNTMSTERLTESNSVVGKMKRFYDSCMGTEYIETDKGKPLERIVKSLGGWQVLRDFRDNDFDFNRLLKKLHVEYRVQPYFKVEVTPDPRSPSRNIIKISPGGLSLPDKKYYFELDNKVASTFTVHAKDMLQLLGANSLNAQHFAQELFNYEKRIAEMSPSPELLRDPVQNFERVTVSELKAMSSTIFWPDFLKGMFPSAGITDTTEVLVTSRQYLTDISSIVGTTDKATKNNYMMWHLAKRYFPYLSRDYAEAFDIFLREITGRRKPVPRWEFCIDETLHYFRHAADFLLSENNEGRAEKVRKVSELFESIRQSLVNRVNEATTKFDESLRSFFLDKLRLMQIHVGTVLLNDTFLKEFYMQLDVQKNEWFTNVRNAIEFQGHLAQKTLRSENVDAPVIQVIGEQPNTIVFLPTSNQVIVPEAVLQRKVLQLESGRHLPQIMGSIGVQLGQAIASAFGIEKGLYGSGGNLMSEKDPKTQFIRDIIDQRRTCLVSFFVNIRLDDRDYLERTSLDTTLHLAGIQLALNALENHEFLETFLAFPQLENLPPSANFFLSYVQSQCSMQSLLYHDMEHYSAFTLSHDHRTRALLRQLVKFTEAMECPSSAELYADFSCGTIL